MRISNQLPNVTTVSQATSGGASKYNALQATFERRFTDGFSFNANTTWAHVLNNAPDISLQHGDTGQTLATHHIDDYGNGDLDVRGRIIVTASYAPAYGSQYKGVAGAFIKGWQANALNVWSTGYPFQVQNGSNISGTSPNGGAADRPNLVGNPFGNLPAGPGIYFFNSAASLDRLTGEHLVTGQMSDTINWASGLDHNGAPIRIPAKDFDLAGALVSPGNQGITNWPPPSYSPETGLIYVPTTDSYAMYYLTTTDPRGAMGLGGKDEQSLGSMGSYITAMDYRTGKVAWRHRYAGVANYGVQNGMLTTAGKLLFAGDPGANLVAYDPANGHPLWHTRINVTNAPETYLLDNHQYILAGAGDMLYAFRLN